MSRRVTWCFFAVLLLNHRIQARVVCSSEEFPTYSSDLPPCIPCPKTKLGCGNLKSLYTDAYLSCLKCANLNTKTITASSTPSKNISYEANLTDPTTLTESTSEHISHKDFNEDSSANKGFPTWAIWLCVIVPVSILLIISVVFSKQIWRRFFTTSTLVSSTVNVTHPIVSNIATEHNDATECQPNVRSRLTSEGVNTAIDKVETLDDADDV
ncbi:uncharacterized protein LOC114538263 [Dendronephthya gigantea]|uniref:uncharacterized protein LOC114538263 n=1 Tax=Dendronephthya gigantea TaxID=151771 RepID=UPI00106B082B|nr:uncharacterized protein LOC114538263 [Dendronephthya gigantea]